MLYLLKDTSKRVVGTKQTLRAIQTDALEVVFVAQDADAKLTNQVVQLAEAKNLQVKYIASMAELGKACNVEVKTAVAGIIH